MKNLDWFKVVLISCSIIIAGFFIGNMHKTGKLYDRYVRVKGLSEREVKSDLAVWPINIKLAGNNLQSLRNDIEKQNEEVYNFFLSQGFDKSEVSRGISNINDLKADIYGSGSNDYEYRYIAQSEFTIRTNNIEKLQEALTESLDLISKGILLSSKNSWRPIEYIFTRLNDLKPSMIEEATKNAREVAEKFARDSNSQVGEIRVARQGLFSINDRDENTPHIKIIRVVSTIDFQLEE